MTLLRTIDLQPIFENSSPILSERKPYFLPITQSDQFPSERPMRSFYNYWIHPPLLGKPLERIFKVNSQLDMMQNLQGGRL
jgi:hypothetical protein